MLRFTIAGDPDVGGIVVASEVANEKTTIVDPATRECIQESIYAARFPPPSGGGVIVVEYPFMLLADDDEKADKIDELRRSRP